MNVRGLLRKIDQVAPFQLAQEWDNVGLMVGDLDATAGRVAVALDATAEAVVAAAERGCQALLAHHPLLFHPVKTLDLNAGAGRVIKEAVRRGVTVLAAHTNWDAWGAAGGGVNGELARLLDLSGCEPLDPNTGLGARGILPEPEPLDKLLERAKIAWGLSRLDCYAPSRGGPRTVERVALCGGAGAEFWAGAKSWGADLYLTADVKYHELMDATAAGLTVAVADHGEMERASLPELARRVGAGGDVEVILLDVRGLDAPVRF